VSPFSFPRPLTADLSDTEFEALRNLWTIVDVKLPVEHYDDPLQRLQVAKKYCDRQKHSPAVFSSIAAAWYADLA
jgi:hypothetical protein